MFPVNHAGGIYKCSAISNDGKLWATGSEDQTIKVWEAESGKLLFTLVGDATINSVAFSPGNKFLLSAQDHKIKTWELSQGTIVHEIESGLSATAEYNEDGSRILSNTGTTWNASTGAMIFSNDLNCFNARYTNDFKKIFLYNGNGIHLLNSADGSMAFDHNGEMIIRAALSPNEKTIVYSGLADSVIKILDVQNGAITKELEVDSIRVERILYTNNGEYLIAEGTRKDFGKNRFADIRTLRAVFNSTSLKLMGTYDGSVPLLSGKMIYFIQDRTRYSKAALVLPKMETDAEIIQYSIDLQWLAMSKGGLSVYNTATKRAGAKIMGIDQWISAIDRSKDGSKLLMVTGRKAGIYNAKTYQPLLPLQGNYDLLTSLQFAADEELIIGRNTDTCFIWMTATGKMIRKTGTNRGALVSARIYGEFLFREADDSTMICNLYDSSRPGFAFKQRPIKDLFNYKRYVTDERNYECTNDGKKFLVTTNSSISVIATENGKKIFQLNEGIDENTIAKFSIDGSRLLVVTKNNGRLFNLSTGKQVWLINNQDPVKHLLFAKDNKTIIAWSDTCLQIWDSQQGKRVSHLVETEFICLSDDAKYILTRSLWEIEDVVIRDLKGKVNTSLEEVPDGLLSSEFLPGGERLLTIHSINGSVGLYSTSNRYAILWDLRSGRKIKELRGLDTSPNTQTCSTDGKTILSIMRPDYGWGITVLRGGNFLKQFRLDNGEEQFSFYPLKNDQYITVDPLNRFDGTPGARQLVYLTCGNEIVSLDQVKEQLWVPNLSQRINSGEAINAPGIKELNICGLTPLVEKDENAGAYNFKITPRRGGLGTTVLYVNNIEVKRVESAALKTQDGQFVFTVNKNELKQFFIDGSDNVVTVKCFTKDNAIASRGAGAIATATEPAKVSPNLYAVMVGVSDYKGDELDLKYAAKDAEDLSRILAISSRKLLNTDGKEHVFVENINTGKERTAFPEKIAIKKVFEEIGKKATANDILLVFFAGHGVMQGEKKNFYFLTADASAKSDITLTGISINELNDWIKPSQLKAQKRILIFDACNSGQAINDLVTIGKKDDNYIAARSDDEGERIKAIEKLNESSGLYILSASATNQSAYELGKYSQGLLTYSLLKCIREQPEILEEHKYLSVDKWFSSTQSMVTTIISQTGNRQQPQKFGTGAFNIGVIDEELIKKISLPAEKPLFTASSFMNEVMSFDDLKIGKTVNRLFQDSSEKESAVISYLSETNSPDAYMLTGRYTVKDDQVIVKANIISHDELVYSFEARGSTTDLMKVASKVVAIATEWTGKRR